MTIEQNIKTLLGEYSFQLIALQQQLIEKDKIIEDLQASLKVKDEK